jgi:hypothetical protein
MMPTVTDYQVLHFGDLHLDAATNNHEANLTWTMPNNFVLGTGLARPIIAFMVAPSEGSHLTVFINSREIFPIGFAGFKYTGFFAPFTATAAFPEGAGFPTHTPVRLFVDQGSMIISNVTMWYQVAI